ncbi:ubiquitin carboxyl-terminal hydrolase 1-like, partial [Actinia tenebrosa]|uniref:Ubiquitin carboxyl-terminal hydrolase 1-like n=1 Tax=Actinia tenebrosa TaxID=6105 RepID=A0A6P8IUJ3_ACTTE
MAPVVASKTPPLSPRSPPRKKAKFSLRLKGKKTKNEEDDSEVKASNVYSIFISPSQKDENYDENNLYKEPEIPALPHAGLLNQGNTCYANAVLQVLRYCPGFEQLVGHLASKEKDVMNDEQGTTKKKDETEELISQLEELLSQMCTFEEDFIQDKENCIHLSEKGNNLVLAAETYKFMEAFRDVVFDSLFGVLIVQRSSH